MENNKIVSKSAVMCDEEWDKIRDAVKNRIENVSSFYGTDKKVFLYYVNIRSTEKLHRLFLDNIPSSARQYYNCNTCLGFINRFGNLVYLNDDGSLHSLLWDIPEESMGVFKDSILAMKNAVENGNIRCVFSFNEKSNFMKRENEYIVLGIRETGEWTHFYGGIGPNINVPSLIREDEFRDKVNVSRETLNAWKSSTIMTVIGICEGNSIRNSTKVKDQCESLLKIQKEYQITTSRNARLDILWKFHDLLYHLKGSSIGSLLTDIDNGVEIGYAADRYNAKVDPLFYKRSQSLPSNATIKEAEKIIAELGAENSLKRRFALLSDIPKFLWKPSDKKSEDKPSYREGIFSKVKSKNDAMNEFTPVVNDGGTISIHTFITKTIKDANKIEILTPSHGNYCAHVTAVDMDAPCIIKYDSKEQRNPITQYVYQGGSDCRGWNVHGRTYVECAGIANYPKDMYKDGISDHAITFYLVDAYDSNNNNLALFSDDLIDELYPVRKVIEAYSGSEALEVPEGQKACGLSVVIGSQQRITAKVYTEYSTTVYDVVFYF